MDRNMLLTPDEYIALKRIISSERESEGAREEARQSTPRSKPRSRRKDPKMARAMRQANSRARLKNGKLRKGWSQSRLMTYAHKLKRSF